MKERQKKYDLRDDGDRDIYGAKRTGDVFENEDEVDFGADEPIEEDFQRLNNGMVVNEDKE